MVLILHYYNSIGIVIEIGTEKKPRTILGLPITRNIDYPVPRF